VWNFPGNERNRRENRGSTKDTKTRMFSGFQCVFKSLREPLEIGSQPSNQGSNPCSATKTYRFSEIGCGILGGIRKLLKSLRLVPLTQIGVPLNHSDVLPASEFLNSPDIDAFHAES
jgi:hypothetical protein